MKTEIYIVNESGEVLETLTITKQPMEFIICRGRLLKYVGGNNYVEQSYLELY